MTDHGENPPAPGARRGPVRVRAPRKVTRASLEGAALAYLGRFATTAQGLEQVLMRRVHRARRHHGGDPTEGAALVGAIIARYREAGLIDDAAFAAARAKTLFGRGLSLRAIASRLRRKGVSAEDIAAAIAHLDPDTGGVTDVHALDRTAARALARRRRLGPWRTGGTRHDMRARDLAALARAGFSYAVARAVIDGAASEDGADGSRA